MTAAASPARAAAYEMLEVPVPGGNLCVGSWGAGEAVVMAIHGLTLTHPEFHLLGEQLARGRGGPLRLIAPDLRGRGGSASLPPPYGLEAHVDDLAAVLGHLACGPAVVLGHSWGAVVALAFAYRHPALVRNLLLVDGGLPPPSGSASAQGAQRASDRVLARLAATFSSRDAYLDTWRGQAGLGPYWNECIERTFSYELAGEPPELRCSLKPEAFMADLATTYCEDSLAEHAMTGLKHRAWLVRSGRNMADEDHPQYSDALTHEWCGKISGLRDHMVQGENHYTIVMQESGTLVLADLIGQALG